MQINRSAESAKKFFFNTNSHESSTEPIRVNSTCLAGRQGLVLDDKNPCSVRMRREKTDRYGGQAV